MPEHIQYAVGISLFIVFFSMTVTTGGFQNYVSNNTLNQYNVTQNDLEVSPDIPDPNPINVDLVDDIEEKQNIEKVNVTRNGENVTALQLDNSSKKGFVFYDVPVNAEILRYDVTPTGGIFSQPEVTLGFYSSPSVTDFETDAISFDRIKGKKEAIFPDSAVYTGYRIDSGSSAKIFGFQYQENLEKGFFESISSFLGSAGNSIGAWLKIITGLPNVLTWIGIAIGIIVLLVIIEMLLW